MGIYDFYPRGLYATDSNILAMTMNFFFTSINKSNDISGR